MKAIIRNNFHGTAKNILLKDGRNEIRGRRLKEWKRALCCSDCECSGDGGLRGDLENPSMVSQDGTPLAWGSSYDHKTGEVYIFVYV
jgi:hypothetical protein